MLLFARKHSEKDDPQIADQLNLGARSLQRGDIVVVKGGGYGKDQVLLPIIRGVWIGINIDNNLKQAGLTAQFFRQGGGAVALVRNLHLPGKLLEGLGGFSLKIKFFGDFFVKGKGQQAVFHLRRFAVYQIFHLVIDAVVHNSGGAVGAVAFDYAGLLKLAVIIQRGVKGFVAGGRKRGGKSGADAAGQ